MKQYNFTSSQDPIPLLIIGANAVELQRRRRRHSEESNFHRFANTAQTGLALVAGQLVELGCGIHALVCWDCAAESGLFC